MEYPRDLTGWPFAEHSQQISCAPHRWHVQTLGEGPTLLLLHGAGGATHSWRGLAPLLAEHARVVMVDLPGHGFTRSPAARGGLNAMAQDLIALCTSQHWAPQQIIAHSAGAAVALRMAQLLPGDIPIVGINPALAPFKGVAGWAFPMMARLLAINPLTPRLFTMGGGQSRQAKKLIEGTGSTLTSEGLALYARLMADRGHVNGTLQMMARWDLDPLLNSLPQITSPCLFLTGQKDRAVLPAVPKTAAKALPNAKVIELADFGHLAHEEAPERVFETIEPFLSLPSQPLERRPN